jgi:hypothetical protein
MEISNGACEDDYLKLVGMAVLCLSDALAARGRCKCVTLVNVEDLCMGA